MTAEKLIAIAAAEIGYHEHASAEGIDSKTANSGSNNFTKYARDLLKAGYYGGTNLQGQAWCDMFVDWCFLQLAGSREKAEAMECQTGLGGAGCIYSKQYYKQAGRLYSSPEAGDQVFFKKNGTVCHTGIVEKVTASYITTIEGNSGDAVKRNTYILTSDYIDSYGRPKYETVSTSKSTTTKTRQVGDIVMFTGTTHYASAGASKGKTCKPGKATITQVYNGKHPYHLVPTDDSTSNVYGWVNKSDVKDLSQIAGEGETTVTVTAAALNIRKGPGLNYPIAGIITDKGTYVITETQNNFGHLASGKGWISLAYTTKN